MVRVCAHNLVASYFEILRQQSTHISSLRPANATSICSLTLGSSLCCFCMPCCALCSACCCHASDAFQPLLVPPPEDSTQLTTNPKMATAQLVSRLHSTRNKEYLKCSASLPGSPNGSVIIRSCTRDPIQVGLGGPLSTTDVTSPLWD